MILSNRFASDFKTNQKMNRRFILFVNLFFLSILSAFAQSGNIKGQVTTSDNQPMEFVNVGVKGMAKGTPTDRRGSF